MRRGWLQLGAVGHQPLQAEGYISTGSLYLCAVGLLHLGLPADDPFWTETGPTLDADSDSGPARISLPTTRLAIKPLVRKSIGKRSGP